MKIRVNGNSLNFKGKTVKGLLDYYKVNQDNVIVEKNSMIIHREKYLAETISESDIIEIVSFVGGG
jgi:sulfur carrier protein